MKKIAIIKLGTLEIKMNIAEILSNQTFMMIDEYRESTKIIEDFENDIPISQGRLNEILATLNNYKTICNSKNVDEVYCFAEYNYKKLKNEHSFFEQIISKVGYRFVILSEKEYIDYLYTAVVSSMNATKGVFIHIDEHKSYVIQYNRRMILNQLIIPFGYATYLYKLKDCDNTTRYNAIKNEIDNIMNSASGEWLNSLSQDTITILQGDIFKNISKLVRKQTRYPFDKDQNFNTNRADILSVSDTLQDMPFDDKKKLKGTTFRADAMVLGAIISKNILLALKHFDIIVQPVEALVTNPLVEDTEIYDDKEENEEVENEENQDQNTILICEFALAHGVLFKFLNGNTMPYRPNDVLDFSLSAINEYYNKNSNSNYVSKLACIIFKQLKVLHKLNRYYLTILKIASRLYDSGARINPNDMDKFGYYVLTNSPIFGVNHREIVLAGFVLMCQNNDNFLLAEWAKYKPLILKDGEDEVELKLACQRLAVILKLARALDRYSNSRVIDIACDNLGECVIMKTTMTVNSTLEIREAKKLENEFRKVFNNKKIEIL